VHDSAADAFGLDATGTLQIVGVPDVGIAGTARVRLNSFTKALDETLSIGADRQVFMKFSSTEKADASGPFVKFSGLGLRLSVLGQMIAADFGFEKVFFDPNNTPADRTDDQRAIKLTASHASFAFGDGTTEFVRLQESAGAHFPLVNGRA